MRAVLCQDYSGHEALSVAEIPPPEMRPGAVRVAVRAAALNFADLLMVVGKYQEKPELPFVPGMEAAGEVLEVAEGVEHCKPGDRVIATTTYGAFAEQMVVEAANVHVVPDAMDFETAAGFPVAYGTAHVALRRRAALQAGETLLVHGAAGGVGLAAVEVGKLLGATVIAAADSSDKLEIVRSRGADHLIDYRSADIRAVVRELTGKRGADVIYDPVGGDVFDASLRCIAWEGRLIVIGFASGRIPSAPTNYVLLKSCSIMGVFWGAYRKNNPAVIQDSMRELFDWYAAGRLKPHASHRFELAQAGEAMATMLGRRSSGKVILTIGGS